MLFCHIRSELTKLFCNRDAAGRCISLHYSLQMVGELPMSIYDEYQIVSFLIRSLMTAAPYQDLASLLLDCISCRVIASLSADWTARSKR